MSESLITLKCWPMSLDHCLTVVLTVTQTHGMIMRAGPRCITRRGTYRRRIEVIRVLLKRGAIVGAEDKQGGSTSSFVWQYG